jgi:hypothetical protein
MNIKEIVMDSVRYPFKDWRKILVLAIIIFISSIGGTAISLHITNLVLILFLFVIGFTTGFFVNGYIFRMVKSSLNCESKPPIFNKWIDMFIDGVKVFIVSIVYLFLPLFFILVSILYFTGFFGLPSNYLMLFGSLGINPLVFLVSGILPAIENFFIVPFDLFGPEFALLIFICMIILLPLFFVAIAHMAYDKGKFRTAFRFQEILEEIACIGWVKLIKWYLVTGIIFLILSILGIYLSYLFISSNFALLFEIISLILISYVYMYYARALALFYMPE